MTEPYATHDASEIELLGFEDWQEAERVRRLQEVKRR